MTVAENEVTENEENNQDVCRYSLAGDYDHDSVQRDGSG